MTTIRTVLRIEATAGDSSRARALVEEAGGSVIEDGPPLVATFPVAGDAVAAAARVTAATAGPPAMALATGEVDATRERAAALAAAGGIRGGWCCSRRRRR